MVERTDPARTGVKAGRVVGLVTAVLAVVSLWQGQHSFYQGVALLLGLIGVGSGVPVGVLFWGNALLAGVSRYAVGYVVGSLIGVLYDWLDRPSLPVLVSIVLAVGTADGLVTAVGARSVTLGFAHILAWLCYVPVFVWLFDGGADDTRSGPRRLG